MAILLFYIVTFPQCHASVTSSCTPDIVLKLAARLQIAYTRRCFNVCGSPRFSSLLSWLVFAPGRESCTCPRVCQYVPVSVSKTSQLCLTYTLTWFVLLLSYPLLPSQPFLFDRAPQKAVIIRKRRRWKVGKVLVQLPPTLHGSFYSLYIPSRFCNSAQLGVGERKWG